MRNRPSKWAGFAGIPGTLQTAPRKARKAPRDKTPESVIQSQCESYLDALSLFYVRIPDSLLRTVFANPQIPIWVKREVSDCLKGLPDLTILKNGRYLACELKRDGGKLSTAQREVQAAIGTVVCESFAQFKQAVDSWLVLGR